MSYEKFKSMTYKNGKVYTRQCSNNVSPQYYDKEENYGLTIQYKKLGEKGFEKWFITNFLMTGCVKVLGNGNKTLQRLNYLSNMLWKNDGYKILNNLQEKAFEESLKAITPEEKLKAAEKYKKAEEDIAQYISSFYDKNYSKYKNERSR